MTVIDSENRKVFISYIRENEAEIDKICRAFEENGIDYWRDLEDIYPGQEWKNAINNAINNGMFFLAFFSKEYENKDQTYMNKELIAAIDILRAKPLDCGWFIPIRLSSCEIPNYEYGAGRTLQDIHYLDLFPDFEIGIERLVDVIKQEEDQPPDALPSHYWEKEFTYRGLKSLIESKSGAGFHNADKGHPVYVLGAAGVSQETLQFWDYADSPEKNTLFKMLSKLSKEFKELRIEDFHFVWWYDFSEWRDFCKFAVDVYNNRFSDQENE